MSSTAPVPADGYDRLRRRRLRSQLLSGPPGATPVAVVGHLLAVQAQDGRGFRLAVRSRSRGLRSGDVDADLDSGRLVVTWLNRGTLHLVRAEDYGWLHRLTAHRTLPGVRRRLRQLGVDQREEDRGVQLVTDALEADGPLTRHELRARLDAGGVTTAGQALVHLLASTSLQGLAVRGPMVGTDHAFVSTSRWLGLTTTPGDRGEDLAQLARRYMVGHAPAHPEDLAAWAGITLGDARSGFEHLGEDARESADGITLATGRRTTPAAPPPRLLGPFDPLLHGWASRSPFVGAHRTVVTTNGIFRPVALVGGRVVGIWTAPGGVPAIEYLEEVGEEDRAALGAEAIDVQRFLRVGGVRTGSRPGSRPSARPTGRTGRRG